MSVTRVVLCLVGISAALFLDHAQAKPPLEGEILWGEDTYNGQYPYRVSLEVAGKTICAGSILSERFVLTAARCVVADDGSFRKDPLKVLAGITDYEDPDDYRVAVEVAEVYVPKEYDHASETGDIAVLKLTKDLGIDGNDDLSIVQLPDKDEDYIGIKAEASTFGRNPNIPFRDPKTNKYVERSGRNLYNLFYTTLTVVGSEDCRQYFTRDATDEHVCAAFVLDNERPPVNFCLGDDGGPLVYEETQIGVFGKTSAECRWDYKTAVFTKVFKYLGFINKVVDGKADDSIRSTTLAIEA